MILKIFLPKKIAKKLAFLTQNKAKLYKIVIITLVFEKNATFCRKLSKIAENCDHNIDPWYEQKVLRKPFLRLGENRHFDCVIGRSIRMSSRQAY
jgi:hypothetical protein